MNRHRRHRSACLKSARSGSSRFEVVESNWSVQVASRKGVKPSFEYSVVDARVDRIIRKKLITLEELDIEGDAEPAEN